MKKRDFLKALILPIIGGISMNPTPSIEKQRTSTSISISITPTFTKTPSGTVTVNRTPICSRNVDR